MAELAFTVLAAKSRAMLSAAQVPKDERYKLWGETVMTATALDNLMIPVTGGNGKTKTRYEHAGHNIPKFVRYLRTFGEAGIVKNTKDGKVGNRDNNYDVCGLRAKSCRQLLQNVQSGNITSL